MWTKTGWTEKMSHRVAQAGVAVTNTGELSVPFVASKRSDTCSIFFLMLRPARK